MSVLYFFFYSFTFFVPLYFKVEQSIMTSKQSKVIGVRVITGLFSNFRNAISTRAETFCKLNFCLMSKRKHSTSFHHKTFLLNWLTLPSLNVTAHSKHL